MQDLLHATTWWKACYAVPLAHGGQMWRWGPVSCITAGQCCRAGLKCSVLISRSYHRRSSHAQQPHTDPAVNPTATITTSMIFICLICILSRDRENVLKCIYSFYFWKTKLNLGISVLIDHGPVDQSWYLHYSPAWAVPVTSWWPAMQVLRSEDHYCHVSV